MLSHESEIPTVYKAEGRRLRPSLLPEAQRKLQADVALRRLESFRDRAEDDPERVQAEMDFEEANLDLENFDLAHDPTGALKRERVGTDLAEQFADRFAEAKEAAPSVVSPEMITPVFLVNMGELDRLNKVNLDFGNEALSNLANIISNKVETVLGQIVAGAPESFYKLYRADNNSFMVRFTEKIPIDLAKSLQKDIAMNVGERWEDGEDMFETKNVEAPPVIADMMSIEDVLRELPPALLESDKAERYAVGAMKDILFTMQDAQKIVSRVERMREAIEKGVAAKDEKEARDLYDKFLKKSIAGIFIEESGPEGIETSVESYDQLKGYLRNPEHVGAHFWEEAYGKVLEDLHIRYENDSNYAKEIQGFVAEKVKEERDLSVERRPSSLPPGGELPPDKSEAGFVEPSKDEATEGLREFSRLRTELGFLSDNLEKAKSQSATEEEINRLEQAMRIAEKKLSREQLKRDSAIGFELRGSMFKRMESALMKSPERPDGSRIANVSIDMGFLKYFDQVGGRETGDIAILKAAEVFESVRDEFSKEGIEVSTHRLGGDEFGMLVTADPSLVSPEAFKNKLVELREALEDRIRDAGKIPAKAGSKPGYYASKMSIGVGIHSYDGVAAAEAEDRKYGLSEHAPDGVVPGTPAYESWVRNRRAEHLVKVADKLMEYQKASGRLLMLLEKMEGIELLQSNGGMEEDIKREKEHLKRLMDYSDKAMFGAAGREHLEEWREQLREGEKPEDLDESVHEFVWKKMEEAFQAEQSETKELESHVEYAVRIKYLEGRIDHLQTELEKTKEGEAKFKERYEHEQKRLSERLKSAEEDLEAVRSVRSSLAA